MLIKDNILKNINNKTTLFLNYFNFYLIYIYNINIIIIIL